jgi:hypothetical protein
MQSSQSASRSSSAFLNLCPCLRHVRICWAKSHRLEYRSLALWHRSKSCCSSGRSNSSRAFIVWICFKMCRIYVDLSDRLLPSSNKNSIKEKGYYCLFHERRVGLPSWSAVQLDFALLSSTFAPRKSNPMYTRTASTIDSGIHVGARTQNHDHSMTLVSFSTMNTIVRSPKNPIPPDEDDDVFAILLYFLVVAVEWNQTS